MAYIELINALSTADVEEIIAIHNGQSCVGEKYEVRGRTLWCTRRNDIVEIPPMPGKQYEELNQLMGAYSVKNETKFSGNAEIARIGPATDPLMRELNVCSVWIDIEHPCNARLVEFLKEGNGTTCWQLREDGEIVFECKDPTASDTNVALGYVAAHKASATVNLDPSDEDVPVIVTGHRAEVSQGFWAIQVSPARGMAAVHGDSTVYNSCKARTAMADPDTGLVDLWEVAREQWRYRGGSVTQTAAVALFPSKVPARAERAFGIPNDNARREARDALPEGTHARGGRSLDLSDIERHPQPGQVAEFPAVMRGGALHAFERDTTWRRGKETVTYRQIFMEADPIRFGLSANLQSLTVYDHRKALTQYPVYQAEAILDWVLPASQLLVTRSPLGWHGLFVLNVAVQSSDANANIDAAPYAYCVPVFVAHKDAVPYFGRYRHLPAQVIDALRNTHGIENFLRQALFTLQGVLAKWAKVGVDFTKKVCYTALLNHQPPTHFIACWANDLKEPKIATCSYNRGRIGKPFVQSLQYMASYLLGFARGNQHVTYSSWGADAVASVAAARALQPVAATSRRVLDI